MDRRNWITNTLTGAAGLAALSGTDAVAQTRTPGQNRSQQQKRGQILSAYSHLLEYAGSLPAIVNTHSHHGVGERAPGLHALVRHTYLHWASGNFPDTPDGWDKLERKYACNTYYRWLSAGLETLYGLSLNAENIPALDEAVRGAYAGQGHDLRVLRETCRYRAIVMDCYPRPGYDNGSPDLFRPTYRCDPFFYGNLPPGSPVPSAAAPYDMLTGGKPDSFEDYISQVAGAISAAKDRGCSAIKLAVAYHRDLRFEQWKDTEVKSAYQSNVENPIFQDAVMYALCDIAAKLELPVQIHTGLGQYGGTQAQGLWKLITNKPNTKFVLFHCGYPWCDDILGLVHNYPNVYPDLCWLPIISTDRAVRMIREALEVGDAERLCWGCDTWTAEESIGALLAARHALAKSLSIMVEDTALSVSYAEYLIKRILHDNAAQLYKV